MWKIITSLLLLCAFSFQAQNTLPLEWSKNPKYVNPGGQYTVAEIAFDETSSNGNALPIKIGNFSNTANFNFAEYLENGVFEAAESEFDAYIAKYDEYDTLLWVKKLNGTGTYTMQHIVVVDNFFYVLGTLSGTVDFNPTTAIANKTSAGDASLVIAKYDLNGFYVNAKVIDFDSSFEVQQFKTNGTLLAIVGEFSGNIDFGLSSNMGSFGGNDGFMALYNTNLSFQSASPIGGLGDDVASDVVFHNNHMYVSSVEQDVLDPMCSADLPTEGAYTGQYQLNVLTSGRFGRLFEDGIVTLTGSATSRRFITTNIYPDIGGYPPINFNLQLDLCGNLTVPIANTGLRCSENNIQLASLNLNNSYNIYNDSTLTLEFYNDVDQSCGTPELTRIELTKVDTPVEDYNIDLSGNTPSPFSYSNYLKKYDLNGSLVLNTALGSSINLSASNLADSKHYLHTNLHVTNNNELALFGAYTGNKSFGNNNASEVPPFSAPLPLPRNTEDVISIFSGAYNNLPHTDYFPDWGQGPESTAYMFNLNGDDMLQFNNLTYQGIQLENGTDIDVSNMEYLHLDVWTNENVTQLETSLINNSNGVVTENAILSPLNANGWTSLDIPISEYTSQGLSVSQIWQLKFAAKQSDWGILGSSTPNGWNGPDMKMFELAPNKYALYADLTPGEFKFRFNNDWSQNYGDNGFDGSLNAGGANIPIAEAGRYYITLDLETFKYTIEAANLSSQGAVFIDNIYFYKNATAKPVKPNLVTASSKTPVSKNDNTASSGNFSLPSITSYSQGMGYFLCKINPENTAITNVQPIFQTSIFYELPQNGYLSAYEAATNSLVLLNKTETQNISDFNGIGFDFSEYELNRNYYFTKFNVDDVSNLIIKPIYNIPRQLIVNDSGVFQVVNDVSSAYQDLDPRVNSTNMIQTSGYPIVNKYTNEGDYVYTWLYNTGIGRNGITLNLNTIDSNNNTYLVNNYTSAVDIDNNGSIDAPFNNRGNLSITKYSASGDNLWTKVLLSENGSLSFSKIQTDANDDLIVFGYFNGNVRFNPNSNEITTSTTNLDGTFQTNDFIAKYNTNGELLWLNTLIQDINFNFYAYENVVTDNDNNIYVMGTLGAYGTTTVDIDPRDDFAFYVNLENTGNYPIFIKYNAQGSIVFAKVGDTKMSYYLNRAAIGVNNNMLQLLYFQLQKNSGENTNDVDLDFSDENEVIVDIYRKEILVNYNLDGEYLSHHILKDMIPFYDDENSNIQSAMMCMPVTDDNNNLYVRARHRKYINIEGNWITNGLDYKDSRLYISKYDANYNLLWEKSVGASWGFDSKMLIHKTGKLFIDFDYSTNADLSEFEENLFLNEGDSYSNGSGLIILDENGTLWGYKNFVNASRTDFYLSDTKLNISGPYKDNITLNFENTTPDLTNTTIWEPFLASYTLDDALSVLEDIFNVNCRVYPNPSKAIIHVKVDHFKSATVHNIMGQKILETQEAEIDLSGHKSGIYLVKVKTSQGKTFVRKVVKN